MFYAKLMLKKFEASLNSFSAPFLDRLQVPLKSKDFPIGIVFFVASSVVLGSLCTKALLSGDSAVYLQQMKNLNFGARSVHIGYYLLGAGFIRIMPGSDVYAINLMNCLLGGLSIASVYFITFIICRKHIIALISGLFLLTHYLFIQNSIYAEVYTPQTCFLLLAVLLWLLDRPIITGLLFALSLLMTPSTIFALPFFFIVRPRLRPLFLFGITALVTVVIVISWVYENYFFSGRGLLGASRTPINLEVAFRKEGREIYSNFFLSIPFVAIGLLELFGRKEFRSFGIGLLTLWAASLFLGERFIDVPVQLPTYALLCVAGGLGVSLLIRIPREKPYAKIVFGIVLSAAVAVILVNGSTAFKKIRTFNRNHTIYCDTMIKMSKVARGDYFVIGDWSRGNIFRYYVPDKSFVSLIESWEWEELKEAIDARRQIWILKGYRGIFTFLNRFGYKVEQFGCIYKASPRK